ncbi:hypothetical protein CJU89_2396 [Yarrowia sp. B02]|nr:hypothetical protein CJU89_2396 [Yarrowia sp. B02]
MYAYPTIQEPQLADQDWYPTTQDFFSYPVPTVDEPRPQYMARSSSFSTDQLVPEMQPLRSTPMKRSYTQPEDSELRRSQSLMALSISTDGRARLQPRDHSPHKLRIEEDVEAYSDTVFSDRSSMSSASSASPQLQSDFPACVPVPVSRSKSCVSLSYPPLPPPAVSNLNSPYSSPSPSVSSSEDEDEVPKNDACVALARLVARKRSKSLKMNAPQRPPHVRSRSLVGDFPQNTMESFQSRARRACAPIMTPPASATDKVFDFGRPSMRSISPKRGRTSMAVAFNYTDDSPHSHFHRRQMSLSDLSQLSLQPVHPEWSN